MLTISIKQFSDNLEALVEHVTNDHNPLKITRQAGEGFIVQSIEDWERDQETLYVLQNSSLMKQILESQETHLKNSGQHTTNK